MGFFSKGSFKGSIGGSLVRVPSRDLYRGFFSTGSFKGSI